MNKLQLRMGSTTSRDMCDSKAPRTYIINASSTRLYHSKRVRAAFRGCATWGMPHRETVIGSHTANTWATTCQHVNKRTWKVGCTVLKSKEHRSPKKSDSRYQTAWDLDLWNFQQSEGHRSLSSCSGSIRKHHSQRRESINFIDDEEFTWRNQLTVTAFVTIGYISGPYNNMTGFGEAEERARHRAEKEAGTLGNWWDLDLCNASLKGGFGRECKQWRSTVGKAPKPSAISSIDR